MRTILLAVTCSLLGCERDATYTPPPPPAPPPPKPAPPKPAVSVPPPAVTVLNPPREAAPKVAHGPLPDPPSEQPKKYAAWLHGLPASDQQRIGAFCHKHPRDFQHVCGGIGPLHIPYPPYPRASYDTEQAMASHTMFASVEAWHNSLTAPQLSYLQRECPPDEDRPSSDLCGDNTPLVIAFDGQPVQFTDGARFAFAAGTPVATDWPTAATPWLALDRDGDGAITSGAELFGGNTLLPDGTTAVDGFAALAALDANHDGTIDARDPAFASLVLWTDRDGDRHGSPDELVSAASVVVAISLADRQEPRCDLRRNCEGERAAITWRDARGVHTGAIVDVYLPRR